MLKGIYPFSYVAKILQLVPKYLLLCYSWQILSTYRFLLQCFRSRSGHWKVGNLNHKMFNGARMRNIVIFKKKFFLSFSIQIIEFLKIKKLNRMVNEIFLTPSCPDLSVFQKSMSGGGAHALSREEKK